MEASPSILDNDLVITLETPDGRVFTGKGLPVSLSYECEVMEYAKFGDSVATQVPGRQRWTLEIVGQGPLETQERNVYINASEWMCVYCGTPNERQIRKCAGCTAPRPFAYS